MTETLAQLIEAPMRTGCAYCDDSHSGSLEDGRAWFRDHLEREHPGVTASQPQKPRPSFSQIAR